jgi:hypothetical protein
MFRYPLVLMTVYNVMDLIASYIPLIKFLKLESRKGLLVATLSRFLLIPAFYFTAKYGDQGWMILLVSYLGLTNGYLAVCVYTVVPKGYKVNVFFNTHIQYRGSSTIGLDKYFLKLYMTLIKVVVFLVL